MSEIRYAPLNLESAKAGQRLEGVLMRYGSVAEINGDRELFRPRAFGPGVESQDVILNVQHARVFPIARTPDTLQLNDSASMLTTRAILNTTDAGREALQLVHNKILRGLSVEFDALSEHFESGVRVIERARLNGIGLVDTPAYGESRVEVRRKGGGGGRRLKTFRGHIPAQKALSCRCSPGSCTEAVFESGALDDALRRERDRDILAVVGEYQNALGSRNRGSVRFWSDRRGGLEVAVDVPDTPRGRAFLETAESVDVFARPSLDLAESVFEIVNEGRRAVYSRAKIRALVLGPTDVQTGWLPLRDRLDVDDDAPPEARAPVVVDIQERRRRVWL